MKKILSPAIVVSACFMITAHAQSFVMVKFFHPYTDSIRTLPYEMEESLKMGSKPPFKLKDSIAIKKKGYYTITVAVERGTCQGKYGIGHYE
jgi:hypothetical protein